MRFILCCLLAAHQAVTLSIHLWIPTTRCRLNRCRIRFPDVQGCLPEDCGDQHVQYHLMRVVQAPSSQQIHSLFECRGRRSSSTPPGWSARGLAFSFVSQNIGSVMYNLQTEQDPEKDHHARQSDPSPAGGAAVIDTRWCLSAPVLVSPFPTSSTPAALASSPSWRHHDYHHPARWKPVPSISRRCGYSHPFADEATNAFLGVTKTPVT